MEYFNKIQLEIESYGFDVMDKDFERPWGGFLVINEDQAELFVNKFFNSIDINTIRLSGKLSPKILIVRPNARLSWQYHYRRAEIWQVFKGEVGIIRSDDDTQGDLELYSEGGQIRLYQGERHRLVGLSDYGVVAEIWQHTCKTPSDESDIVRIYDDYNRN